MDKLLNYKVKTKEDAILGAKYIIVEYISDNTYYWKYIRDNTFNHGLIVSKLKRMLKIQKGIWNVLGLLRRS